MKRIEELDFTRIIAMIAVITIQVTSAYIGYQSNIDVEKRQHLGGVISQGSGLRP